jgi:hypothetical protein
MNKIILSCGHEVDDFDDGYEVMVKATDRRGEKAISYMVVCGACEDRYRQSGDLFDHENAADAWLMTEEW